MRKTSGKGYWVAQLGRLDCGHRHRSRDAAERCLLKWRTPGSRDLGRVVLRRLKPLAGAQKNRHSSPTKTTGRPGTICIRCRQSMWLLEGDTWICGGCELREA